jgi:radical SAM-linked protein
MSRIIFRKEGRAKYISHLDLMRTMQRVFIRAGVRIKHTEGFNPHPYMAFALPLSVGMESDYEILDFKLTGGATLEELPELITRFSPEGITVLEAYEEERKLRDMAYLRVKIRLIYDSGVPAGAVDRLRELYSRDSLVVEKFSKGKMKSEDIAPMIAEASFEEAEGEVIVDALLSAQTPALSPNTFLNAIDTYFPDLKPDFVRVRRKMLYDKDKKVFR